MSFVTLVRHGQANTGARDETEYDRLSPLGWQQSRWLGEWFTHTGEVFARRYCGSLRRHRETTQGIGAASKTELITDPRLNELDYFTMAQLLHSQHGIAWPTCREEFLTHLPTLFQHWKDDKLEGAPERFETFQARIQDVLTEIAAGDGRALVVTSGGVIGAAMSHVLRLDVDGMAQFCLAVENTSLHRIQTSPKGLFMTQFNAIPHLDTADRQHARTHI